MHTIPTPEQIAAFDIDELLAGGQDYAPGDPEPGPNRSQAFWWGWWARKNPRLEDGDPRGTEIYWAMRAYIRSGLRQ